MNEIINLANETGDLKKFLIFLIFVVIVFGVLYRWMTKDIDNLGEAKEINKYCPKCKSADFSSRVLGENICKRCGEIFGDNTKEKK